jgi:hypothetical protein
LLFISEGLAAARDVVLKDPKPELLARDRQFPIPSQCSKPKVDSVDEGDNIECKQERQRSDPDFTDRRCLEQVRNPPYVLPFPHRSANNVQLSRECRIDNSLHLTKMLTGKWLKARMSDSHERAVRSIRG